ncbi:hypothetical protein CXF85_16810 [Colwellia sp. 75C3]|uniref:efflux RND transporter periplasmic adaptor subunit n=1 Tax=Colwellia sp. 75C3 TaxID=888425 RepID=UPI000C3496FB|nr:HlyD family efflux transporter periplasmic adaptor subunit [Colwellia sp. 75C3]PKG81869.1 hypothetical protein CXF85_16810 [Colwellia sp. 75C3]
MTKFSRTNNKNTSSQLDLLKQRSLMKSTLPIIILIIAVLGSYFIYHSGKSNLLLSTKVSETKKLNDVTKSKNQKKIRIVNTQLITVKTHIPLWQTTGVVKPAQTLNLKAEVAGVINKVNPDAIPGALIHQGETLLTLNSENFQYALINKKSALIQAQSTLSIEKGNQVLALEAFAFMPDDMQTEQEKSLVLREPQIASAIAKVMSNQASVDKAKADLAKTEITMPFTGKIQKRNISLGASINANSSLYQILNIEQFWLEVKIPRQFFTILDKKQPVLLTHQQNRNIKHTRLGNILTSLTSLDSRDRQIQLLVSIDDPLLLNKRGLIKATLGTETQATSNNSPNLIFINDFLFLSLHGKPLENTVQIKPHWLIANDYIWVVDQKNTLQQRKVEVVFQGKKYLFVRGNFFEGDHALTDKLSIAVSGMKVKKRSLKSLSLKDKDNV